MRLERTKITTNLNFSLNIRINRLRIIECGVVVAWNVCSNSVRATSELNLEGKTSDLYMVYTSGHIPRRENLR
jgi:hypothetical protein